MTLKDRLITLQNEARKSPLDHQAYLQRFDEACRDLYLTITHNWLEEEIQSEPSLIEASELTERKYDAIKGEYLAVSLYLKLPNSNFIILEPLEAFSSSDFGSILLKGSVSSQPRETSILYRESDKGKGASWKIRNPKGRGSDPVFTRRHLELHIQQWL
jgi:hypothetical protein